MKRLIGSLLLLLGFNYTANAQQNTIDEIQKIKSTLHEKQDGDKILALKDIGLKFRSINVDSAKYYLDKGYAEAEALNSDYHKALLISSKGILAFDAGKFDEALKLYEQAKPALEASNNHSAIGALYNNISNVYERTGKVDEAVKVLLEGLKHYEIANDSVWIAGSYINLGNKYKFIKETNLAIEAYIKAKELYKQLGNQYYEAFVYNNMANTYVDAKEFEKSISLATQSYKLFDKLGIRLDAGYPFTNLGVAHLELDRLDSAEFYLNKALALQVEKQEQYETIFLKKNLANVFLKKNELNKAKTSATEAFELAKQNNVLPFQQQTAETLSNIYKSQGDYKKAFKYLQESAIIRDSLLVDERAKEVLNLKEKYETEQKENQILRQQNQLVASELTLKKRNMIIAAISGLVVFILAIGFFVFRVQSLKAERIKRDAELQKAVAEAKAQENLKEQRIRIARDLHDNIGSQLTYIISIAETTKSGISKGEAFLAEKLTQMKQFSLTTISELRDTIWAMNKDEISMLDIQERTQQLAAAIHDATDDQIQVKIESSYGDKILNTFTGMNLFRIIQESVNNAVKHADTKEVLVEFNYSPDKVDVSIVDYGVGFDTENNSNGNGLYIMKNRALKARIDYELTSQINVGTKISLTVEDLANIQYQSEEKI
ncbi:tetratricopeptide repeat-containing sensor histidine kinase [Chondrinema litorale]|uniref:tetratricopeptide repeat-containing sensor histidine kinase n=1 Tax=Chondrinema litorale TaxID=2994555 RepID=UPI0025428E9B|nr:tetratricopeptide repeat-containing sensor histidine kinase [Chondrinema litorale]UZR97705.1 tetratricopeptide repeat protein [Chondrinema litorale]